MKPATFISRHLRLLTIALALVTLSFCNLNAQTVNITINNPNGVNVCDIAEQSQVEILNITSETLTNGSVTITFPTGILYEASSLTEFGNHGMQEFNISDLSSVIFTFASLPAGETLEFAFSFSAKMDAIAFQDANNVFRNVIDFNSTQGNDSKTSNAYNLFYPVLSITKVNPSQNILNSGESMTRDITIINAGNGRVSSFYIDDLHNSGIEVTAVSKGILNATKDRISFTAADFTGIGNNDDYFDTNESIIVTENISALGCQEGTITSTIKNAWGCESIIEGSNNYAHITVALKTPSLSVSTSSELSTCFGVGEASNHTLTIKNNGQGVADAVILDLYKSLGDDYDQNIFSRIDANNITYQFTGDSENQITPTQSIATSTDGDYSCLGNNAIGRVILDLPDIEAGKEITIRFQTYHCNVNICNGDHVSGWKYELDYTDFCKLNTYDKSDIGQEPNEITLNIFPETPTDIVDGQTDVFDFTVSSFESNYPSAEGARAKVVFTIEPGLEYIDLEFDHNIVWESLGDPVFDSNNNTLTAYYPLPAPTGFSISKSRFHLTLKGNCAQANGTGGEKNISLSIYYIPDTNCEYEIPLSCDDQAIVDLHCPSPDCNGLRFYNFDLERISYGAPDNDQNGLPDASGTLDFDNIKTNRAMFGDTLLGSFYGLVKSFPLGNEWQYGFASQDIEQGQYLAPISAYIRVFDQSENNYKEAVGVPLVASANGKYVYDVSVSALAALDAAFSGFSYANGDSLWLYAEYKIIENIGNNILQLKSTNEFYLSDNNTYGSGSKEQCDHFNDNYTLIGSFFKNETRNSINITSCSKRISQDLKLSIGDCCSNYSGGNLFPYEYRNWAHPKTATISIPSNYAMSNVKLIMRRTLKTNSTKTESIVDLTPLSVEGNLYTFDLEQYYLSGELNYPDDGFNGTLQCDLSPNCDVPVNTYQNVEWKFNFVQSVYLGGGESGMIEADRLDRVKVNPPALKLTSNNPIIDGLEKTVVWDLKVATSNSRVNAQYAWVHFKNPSGDVTILKVINDDTGEEIPLSGDIYQLGDITGNSPSDLSIVASYGACVPDYITAYSGYECTAFPATFADFRCDFTTLGLFVEPKPAKMQVALYSDNVGDDCSNVISIELDILSAKFASVDNISVSIEPVGSSISFQNGSGQFAYPSSEAYTPIGDPSVTANGYSYSIPALNTYISDNGLPGVLNIGNNRAKLKFNMVMDNDFLPGDYVLVKVAGQAVCGEDISTIFLAYDPSVGFKVNTLAGITDQFTNSWSASWGDFNRDGYDDLFVTTYDDDESNYLYTNNGDKTFTKMTSGAIVTEKASSIASTWGDYNNDGYLDLFVANNVGFNNCLYKNNGDATFTKIITGAIVTDGVYCHSAAWADFDNDGYLDLFVAEYFPTKSNHLFRNNGDETFTPVEGSPVVQDAGHSIGAAWGDYNNDGLVDLFVPNTEGEANWLYKNIGNGNFVKVNEDVVSTASKSVGCSWGDYNNDTYLDLFIANAGGEANFLYQNNGDGTFTSITEGHIVNEMSNSHGSVWFDMDNDGHLDLFVTNDKGEDNFLYRNNGDGTFSNQSNGMTQVGGNSFGTAVSDFDNDGDFDLFVANHSDYKDFFFENTKGQCNQYLCFTVQGINSNYSGIGARAYAKANIYGVDTWQTREVSAQTGGGAGSQSSMKVIFGLGDASIVDSLILEFPSGYRIVYTDIAVSNDNCNVYLEGQGAHICGVAYIDANGNCEYDDGETLLKGAPITILPSEKLTYTNANGEYNFYMNTGDYSINAADLNYYTKTCPDNGTDHTVSVTQLGADYCGMNFGYSTTTDKPDLTACLSTTMLRVNFTNKYTIVYENQGAVTAYNNELTMTLDEHVEVESSTLPWSNQQGQTLTWNISEIDPQEQVIFYVTTLVTTQATVGEYGTNSININSASIEADDSNNGCDDTELFVGAVDPNDKIVYPGEAFTKGDPITYKIRFQNVGNFPADNVAIYDTLTAQLDASTIFNMQASHEGNFTITNGNILKWEFPEINLLDSVHNEPESHGYVQFSIYPKDDVRDYSSITNTAMIVFDYYQFTQTNTTTIQVRPLKNEGIHLLDLKVSPNPVLEKLDISFISDSKTNITIKLINVTGQEVLQWKADVNIGYNNLSYEIPKRLEGVHFVTLNTSELIATEKIIIK